MPLASSWSPYDSDPDEDGAACNLGLFAWTVAVSLVPLALLIAWTCTQLAEVSGYEYSFGSTLFSLWRTFNWHPLLMMLSFGMLFSQALIAFKLLPIPWRYRKLVHMTLQIVTWILGTLGIVVVHEFKLAGSYPEFYTVHGQIGIATYGLFTLQLLLGLLFFWRPQLFICILPVHENFFRSVLPWHILAGLAIYLGAVSSIVTGLLNRQWLQPLMNFSTPSSTGPFYNISNFCAIFVLILAWSVYYQHKVKRNYAVEDQTYSRL